MVALDLISDSIPPLRTSDTGEIALQLMSDYQVKQLPIVNNQQFLGLISEEDILESGLIEEPIGSQQLSYHKPFALANDHLYQVMKIAANLRLSIIPVIDDANNYKGLITLEILLQEFAKSSAISDPGGIFVLEVGMRDYSLTEISRIVEGNDATILSMYTSSHNDSTKREITIKVDKEDIKRILTSFERYGYKVIGSFQKSDMGDDLKDRYDSLIRYLNP